MFLGVHQFLIVSRGKRFLFRNHVVNTHHHHSCDGNDCFLMATTLFDPPVLDCKIRLIFALNSDLFLQIDERNLLFNDAFILAHYFTLVNHFLLEIEIMETNILLF